MIMGTKDKASNEAQDLKGKVKETVGAAIGDDDLEAKGRSDQTKSALKGVAEKVKDVASSVKDTLPHAK